MPDDYIPIPSDEKVFHGKFEVEISAAAFRA